MNRLFAISFFLLVFSAWSQEKLTPLNAPNSPASSLLGMQPTNVLNPKSYRALETALFSNFSQDGEGTVPDDFALEFTPFWVSGQGITLKDFLYPKGLGTQLWRNSSFSIASTQHFLLEDGTKTKSLTFGYRTSIFLGNENDFEKVRTSLAELSNNQRVGSYMLSKLVEMQLHGVNTKDEYLTLSRQLLEDRILVVVGSKKAAESIVNNVYEAAKDIAFENNHTDSFFEQFTALIEDKMLGSYEDFKKYLMNREGLSIDVAYAGLINFPDNDFEYSEVPRQSVWLTPSYNFSGKLNFLRATAALRYEWFYQNYFAKYFPAAEVFDNNFDYGLAISGEFEKYTVQFEGTGRLSSSQEPAGVDENGNLLYTKKSASDFQYVASLTYRLTEQIALTYQFGNGFKPIFTGQETLISLLSLNFGFGGPNFSDVKSK